MLIDTHFHLDLMENMQSLISEFRKVDVRIIAVGTTPKANKKEKQFCSGVENIKVAAGLHPQLITERKHEIDQLLELVKESRFVGEIGLDFNSGYIASKEQQLSCFRKIIKACADEGNKVLSIHSVKAVGVAIDELKVAGAFQNNICIFHWFTGTAAERKKAIEAGAWFSINPRMLKTKSGQETIKQIPADRILLDTDAPFTMKIGQVNDLKITLEELANGISAIRESDMIEQIEDNGSRIW